MEQSEQERLETLLLERKSLFGKYADQMDKKSGIFGRRNKRDEAEANKILEQVIIKDNAIFQELDRLIDQNQFESKTLGQRMLKQDESMTTHVENNEKLLASYELIKNDEAKLKKQISGLKLRFYLSLLFNLLLAGWIGYIIFKKRKNTHGGIQ